MTFLALHNYLGLTTELFNCVSLGYILFAVVHPGTDLALRGFAYFRMLQSKCCTLV